MPPNDPMREIIVLAACGANEVLPQVWGGRSRGVRGVCVCV